ncbi:MAG: MBL fold metallo-hydrolase [Treponema sp.]|jgi:glyoxylase-like metal-dependent hydrolase (beta-lactamase superfamily II)|nr:MBL fold metallo-hydrolase [Treponema sp.]
MKHIVCGILIGTAITGVLVGDDLIFSYKVGQFDVYMLVENSRQAAPSILIGAKQDDVNRYLPSGTYTAETNTFLIKGEGKTVVVDTGFGTTIFDSMKKLGVSLADVDAVLLTHLHGDHIGGLSKGGKALFSKAKVYLATREIQYWTINNVNQGAVNALKPYADNIETFNPGELDRGGTEILPGIHAIAAFGHTPGHTVFLLESVGDRTVDRLLIWGDLMHVQGIQFPLPDVSVTYDTDPIAAAAVRKQILAWATQTNTPVAGMHLAFPAIGSVKTDGNGYKFIPLN